MSAARKAMQQFRSWSWIPAVLLWALLSFRFGMNALFFLPAVPVLLYIFVYEKAILLPALVLLVPLSISAEIGGGAAIDFPSEALVGIIALLYGGRVLLKKSLNAAIVFHPLVVIAAIEVAWMLVCALSGDYVTVGLKRVIVRSCYLFVFLILFAHWFEKRGNRINLWLIYALGCAVPVLHTLFVHAQLGFSTAAAYFITRPFFVDHTLYGVCLAFLLPGLFLIFFNPTVFQLGRAQRFFTGALLLLVLIGLVFAYSRAAWISIVGAVALAVLIRLRVRLWMLILLLAGATVFAWMSRETIIRNVSQGEAISTKGSITEHIESVTNLQTDASNLERINRWACAIQMAEERPWTGFGPGSYQFEYGRFQVRKYMTRISTFSGNKGHAHSEFFTALSEDGFPGMMLYIVLMFATIGFGLQVIYKAADPYLRKMALATVLSLSTFYIHGFFNAFLDTDKMALLVFGGMALIVSSTIEMKKTPA